MKKLRLTALSLGAKEVLTRAQLKNVLGGGDEGGSGSGSGPTVSCSGGCAGYSGVMGQTSYHPWNGSCSLKIDKFGADCSCSGSGTVLTSCSAPA